MVLLIPVLVETTEDEDDVDADVDADVEVVAVAGPVVMAAVLADVVTLVVVELEGDSFG